VSRVVPCGQTERQTDINLLTQWSKVLREKLIGFQAVKKFPGFCGTRRFITAFQVSATCPYPQPARSVSHFLKTRLNIIHPSTPGSPQVVSYTQVSPSKPCVRLSFPPYALHAPPISFFSIRSPEQYCVSITNH